MRLLTAIRQGFFGGRGKGLATALFYLATLLLGTFAISPLRAGFHAALDRYPDAARFLTGSGMDLLAETVLHQPAMWAAGFAELRWMLLAQFVIVLLLTAGAYSIAARGGDGPVWRAFWPGAARYVLPFAGLFFLNLVVWAALGSVVALALFGVHLRIKDLTDPGPAWHFFLVSAAVVGLVLNLFRNSVGYSQARYVLTEGREGMGRCFIRAFAFTFRRFIPVNVLTWLINVVRAGAVFFLVFVLSPGYATGGKIFATALLYQLGFLAVCYLRVGEIGAQVAYQRSFLEPAPPEAEPEPPRAPAVREETTELPAPVPASSLPDAQAPSPASEPEDPATTV